MLNPVPVKSIDFIFNEEDILLQSLGRYNLQMDNRIVSLLLCTNTISLLTLCIISKLNNLSFNIALSRLDSGLNFKTLSPYQKNVSPYYDL